VARPNTKSNISATTNNPLVRADGRSAQGRRVRDLFRSYCSQLGNPTDAATQAGVLAAAELIVAAEAARANLLAGRGDINAVVRVENLAARALRRLDLGKPVAPHKKSFIEKAIEREAAQREAEGRGEADTAEGTKAAASGDQRTGEAGSQSNDGGDDGASYEAA
jgi:hypothetical protein